jgi:hypothetical protein
MILRTSRTCTATVFQSVPRCFCGSFQNSRITRLLFYSLWTLYRSQVNVTWSQESSTLSYWWSLRPSSVAYTVMKITVIPGMEITKQRGRDLSIPVAARPKTWTVFARSNTGILGSDPTRGTDVPVRLFRVCVVLCVCVCVCVCVCADSGLPTVYG